MPSPNLSALYELFKKAFGVSPSEVIPITSHASPRKRYRLKHEETSCVGVISENTPETRTFWYFTDVFRSLNLPVPEVYIKSADEQSYLEEDLGDETLFSKVQKIRLTSPDNFPQKGIDLYKKSLEWLAKFQIETATKIDFTKATPFVAFDKSSMMLDLRYFEREFLSRTKLEIDPLKLEEGFLQLVDEIYSENDQYFMYRDFQARNIMVKDKKVFFIDYQGGRRGPLQYDVASLVYQSKACIPVAIRKELVNHYSAHIRDVYGIAESDFYSRFYSILLLRILQVLGTYGAQGLRDGKEYFKDSIPPAIKNLEELLPELSLPSYLEATLQECTVRYTKGDLF